MHSIRSKITIMTVCIILIAISVASILGVITIKRIGNDNANQLLVNLCAVGEKNLDFYFGSVEKTVEFIASYAEDNLDGIDDNNLQEHLDHISDLFSKMIYKTNGVLTYYYRIDPSISDNIKGFWYVNLDKDGFVEHEVTDITLYDTEDTSSLVWFTVPKYEGKAIWLPPYITDNLDVRVLSYNVPVYYQEQFIGVIGIEIDYSTMTEQVDAITLYKTGYAFINDENGTIIYHPKMDVTTMEVQPKVPDGLIDKEGIVNYTFEGQAKRAAWIQLRNGMRLNVSVPVSEINESWIKWVIEILIIFAFLLILFIIIIITFTGHITKPLRDLTKTAEEVDSGNYDCNLDYDENDEVGALTQTFKKLTEHLKLYIEDLNDRAYTDSLTSLHNKGAFDVTIKSIQSQINGKDNTLKFAVCMFDCNDLKRVNDTKGHDKGNIYLKEAADTICKVFSNSPVFRIGGDEFAAILLDKDFDNRDKLIEEFDKICEEKQKEKSLSWEQLDVARGLAIYDPTEDSSVSDVVRRADRLMYENKWSQKEKRRLSLENK